MDFRFRKSHVGWTEGDIFENRRREQLIIRILEYKTDTCPDLAQCSLSDRDSTYPNFPFPS
jgi:hypothetical protein